MKNVAKYLCIVTVSVVGLAGCAGQAPTDSEAVGSAAEAWDTGCDSATPDVDWSYCPYMYYTSPTTYNNAGCFKSEVLQVDYLSCGGATFYWNGPVLNDATSCRKAWMGVYAWQQLTYMGPWTLVSGSPFESLGSWDGSSCTPPAVNFVAYPASGNQLNNDEATLFAVTARDEKSTSANTESFGAE